MTGIVRNVLEHNLRLFAEPRRFVGAAAVYCAGHYLWRTLSSPALGRDDVEQALFAQHWALTYDPGQPPLYTWLLRALIEISGANGVAAHALLKAVLVFLALLALSAAADLLFRCQSWGHGDELDATVLARLAAAAPLLTVVLGWEMLQLYTHTVVLFAAMPALLWALLRLDPGLRESPVGARDFILLGAVLGLGLLSKYSFPLFACALLGAALCDAALRRALLTWRFPLALALAAAIAGPHYAAVATAPEAFRTAVDEAIGVSPGLSRIEALLAVFESIASAALAFLALPLPIVLACFRPWRRCWRRSATPGARGVKMLEGTAVGIGLIWFLGVIALGVGRVQPHHLVMPFALLPLWYLLAGPAPDRARCVRFAAAISGITLGAALALPVKNLTEVSVYDCRLCYLHRPYAEIAGGLRRAGFTAGTVIVNDRLLAGGLVPFLPNSLVLSAEDSWFRPPTTGPRQCLLVWQVPDAGETPPPRRLRRFAETRLEGEIGSNPPVQSFAAPYATQSERLFTVAFLLAVCRI